MRDVSLEHGFSVRPRLVLVRMSGGNCLESVHGLLRSQMSPVFQTGSWLTAKAPRQPQTRDDFFRPSEMLTAEKIVCVRDSFAAIPEVCKSWVQ